jgi:hypothetical protein
MCFQVLRGDLGEVLAESGIMNISLASKIAGLARAVRNVAFDPNNFHSLTQKKNTHTQGPITDLAISTNSDEAGALQSMGYEVLSARPFEKANRLWACRMCSKYPILDLRRVSLDELKLLREKETYLESLGGLNVEYLKLGNDVRTENKIWYLMCVVFDNRVSISHYHCDH